VSERQAPAPVRGRDRERRAVDVRGVDPEAGGQAADDLEVLESVATLAERVSATAARYEAGRLIREFRATLLRELDYRMEAENLRALGRNLRRFERLFVPQPVADYSTSRVLTMDYVAGTKVTALSRMAHAEMAAADLADVQPAPWDALEFDRDIESRRAGRAAWTLSSSATIFGFALWWECTLVPGVVLSTSPFGARTHWDQIYLPLLEPLAVRAGDELALDVSSETGGGEGGIDVRWSVEQRRGGAAVSHQSLDIGSGFLG